MKGNNDPFIKRFNKLDALCKRKYPNKKNGFSAIREFIKTLSKDDQDTLQSLIQIRNTIHNTRDLVAPRPDALKFLDGLIKALEVGTPGVINPDLENLKSDNLKKMSVSVNQYLSVKIRMLSPSEQEPIKAELNKYIAAEKGATDVETAKRAYFGFYEYFKNINSLPVVKNAQKQRKAAALEKEKQEAMVELLRTKNEAIADAQDAGWFGKGKIIKKIEAEYERYKELIQACTSFDALEKVLEDVEEYAFCDYT